MARIGIFGGSFNPPHLGHMLAVREFQKKLSLDLVLLIPASIPPHKQLSSNSPDAQTRLELTRLAAAKLPNTEVLDIELNRQGTSYTADTLTELKERYPNDALFLLMGTDMFFSFEKWYHPERITNLATIAVAHRNAEPTQALADCAQRLKDKYNARIEAVENDYLPHSSTSVRAMLAFGCAQEYLSPQVLDYITANKLYYVGENLKELPFERLSEVSLSLHMAKRVRHVIGCSQTAGELAKYYGENVIDAKRAGILHDITKALNAEEQLHLCEKYDIILNQFERENPKLLHAKTGATIAKKVFGESDAVYHAIYCHTTGKAQMNLLEKIIYLADYMEPNRDFSGVDEMRRLAYMNLDDAMLMGLRMSIEQLTVRNMQIDPNSLAALHFLEAKL
ncbi:MAG: nicotinate (nicotinamide) nucleotide adenylyltransferase [Ruminococcaceae bacterium]|nr:nicotinate (nicotinamide) nucleotide adenylyltransferase [Oscillospiraceae bacterium]